MAEFSTHLTLIASPLVVTLPGAGGTALVSSERRIITNYYSNIRMHYAESLGSALISIRIEWRDLEQSNAWATLIPDVTGINGSANIPLTSAEVELIGALRSDIRLRAVVSGNGLLTPTIQYIEIEFR